MGDTTAPRWEVGVVYVLCDPHDGAIRYCGKTTESPRNRLMEHLRHARGNTKRHLYHWIRGLLRENLEPVMKVCTKVDLTMLQQTDARALISKIEVDWIAALRADGHRLTNATNGGDGCHGRVLSEETKKKISISNIGKERSLEWRRNIREACRKKPASAYVRGEKHPHFGKKQVWKDCEARVRAIKQTWSDPDLRAKHSVRMRGTMCQEERVKQSLRHRGLNNTNAKLANDQVLDIYVSPKSCSVLAKEYNVSKQCILRIKRGKTHKWLTQPLGE